MKVVMCLCMLGIVAGVCVAQEKRQYQDREEYLRKNIDRISKENFPDDQKNTWKILGFTHRETQTYVEVEPSPKTVGYDKFKYLMDFSRKADAPACVAVYAWEKGKYSLLFTEQGWEKKVPATPE